MLYILINAFFILTAAAGFFAARNKIKLLRLRISCAEECYDKIFRKYINTSDRLLMAKTENEELQKRLDASEKHIIILRQEIFRLSKKRKH